MSPKTVVRVEHLQKKYGSIVAVRDVSFEVFEGEIFGMVGPNGAGKTTTIECLEGLRRPDQGKVQVLGLDPIRDGAGLRMRLGIQFQESALQARLKVWEALDLFASFYEHPADWKALLKRLGLDDQRNTPVAKLSGGQKQRLFIALALVNHPELVFLDELTTGLDPQARRLMWGLVEEIRHQGRTIVLSTHFMEEAERLCDRVAIMDHGRVVALDSPANLIRRHSAEQRVAFVMEGTYDLHRLRGVQGVTKVQATGEHIVVYGQGPQLVGQLVNTLTEEGLQFRDLRTEHPTLEDVFLALTGSHNPLNGDRSCVDSSN